MAIEYAEENMLPSDIPFQDLQELSNQYGSNMFSDILCNKNDDINKKRKFQRENKNRPREMSSKIPPFKCLTKAISKKFKSEKTIDPRFHPSFGSFDQKKFEENFKFLNNIKKKEKKMLKKKLSNPQLDNEEREQIQKLLQRINNQRREEVRKKQETKLKTEEREYEIEQLKQGHKPEYCKKSEEKLLNLVRKFETMKERGGLQKHIKRRRKKSIRQDKKTLGLINNV